MYDVMMDVNGKNKTDVAKSFIDEVLKEYNYRINTLKNEGYCNSEYHDYEIFVSRLETIKKVLSVPDDGINRIISKW